MHVTLTSGNLRFDFTHHAVRTSSQNAPGPDQEWSGMHTSGVTLRVTLSATRVIAPALWLEPRCWHDEPRSVGSDPRAG